MRVTWWLLPLLGCSSSPPRGEPASAGASQAGGVGGVIGAGVGGAIGGAAIGGAGDVIGTAGQAVAGAHGGVGGALGVGGVAAEMSTAGVTSGAGGALGGSGGQVGAAGVAGNGSASAACAAIATEYAAELAKQLACDPKAAGQCADRAVAAPGCSCRVFIEPSDPFAIEKLANIATGWFDADCPAPKCDEKCSSAQTGICQPDPKSMPVGKCVSP